MIAAHIRFVSSIFATLITSFTMLIVFLLLLLPDLIRLNLCEQVTKIIYSFLGVEAIAYKRICQATGITKEAKLVI